MRAIGRQLLQLWVFLRLFLRSDCSQICPSSTSWCVALWLFAFARLGAFHEFNETSSRGLHQFRDLVLFQFLITNKGIKINQRIQSCRCARLQLTILNSGFCFVWLLPLDSSVNRLQPWSGSHLQKHAVHQQINRISKGEEIRKKSSSSIVAVSCFLRLLVLYVVTWLFRLFIWQWLG